MDLLSYKNTPVIGAYYYTGWYPLKERAQELGPHWTEWELVLGAVPRFSGHQQPNLPLFGPYDNRSPGVIRLQQCLARAFSIDFFCFGVFWSRGERYFEAPLDDAFIAQGAGEGFPFCVMWVNRLPRKILPVRLRPKVVIEDERRVKTDIDDFLDMVRSFEALYFSRKEYVTMGGAPVFLIFDSIFFIRQLGVERAKEAVSEAKDLLRSLGYPGGYFIGVNPTLDTEIEGRPLKTLYSEIGFDALTHYVFLPEWKGDYLQDYEELSRKRESQWWQFGKETGLPYYPSISTGWDATPRGAIFKGMHPRRYPWWPVVTGNTPGAFFRHLKSGVEFSKSKSPVPLVFVASWNEWSEGHFIEPCERWGFEFLKAVAKAKQDP